MTGLRGPVIVTGTDTGVGKTITTAAIAAAAGSGHGSGGRGGLSVAVLKPAQTGVVAVNPPELGIESDVETVVRLAAPAAARTIASYPDPLAPAVAARVCQRPPLELGTVLGAVAELVEQHDLVLIEGAGGLLVPMGANGWTVADLADRLGAPVVVVARAGLGTLNHTALTMQALSRSGIEAMVVIGAWPAEPGLVHATNLEELPDDLAGVIPEGAGSLSPEKFRASAPNWLAPRLHGHMPVRGLDLLP